VRKNIKLFKSIIFLLILLLTNSKAELTNKVIIRVGSEIITDYDITREIKYLNVLTMGSFENLDIQEAEKIAVDSLIKDKVKINALINYENIIINDKLINDQIARTTRDLGFRDEEDLKTFLVMKEYTFEEFKKKITLELRWNQLIYQFYKNQIIVNKEKIDKKLKILISKQRKREEYLISEIFIEDSSIKKLNEKNEEVLTKDNIVKKQDETIIKTEIASYDNEKNSINVEKSIEEKTDNKANNQITIDELIENIQEKGFENTAIQFSSSSTSQQGGKLDWINESEFSEILLKYIKKTKIGTITEPISVPGGIIILKIENKRFEENKIDFEKKMEELIKIEKNNQLNQFSTNYFNQVKNNIKIKYFND
jgi:peptidyl-prolyl cis-trans isomerase SurA